MFRVIADFFQSHTKDFQITGLEYETDSDAVPNPAPFIFNTQPQLVSHFPVNTDCRTDNYNNNFRNDNAYTNVNCSTSNNYNAFPNPYSSSGGSGSQDFRQDSAFPSNTSLTAMNFPQTSNVANDGTNLD